MRNKPNDYVFSALCLKYSIYKNPTLKLTESELSDAIVDGAYDGGADFVLIDPNNNEAADLIIGQSKYYNTISADDARNAVHRMVDFYCNMRSGQFSNMRFDVVNRFQELYAEVGEESKFIFDLFVSAPRRNINVANLKRIITDQLGNEDRFELNVFFEADIEDEINEAESRQPYVEHASLEIDRANNVLFYGEDENAVIVNISALSLKRLYATYGNNLLSMNLRYFTQKADIDSAIKETIRENPESFWYKNNGLTIVCDNYDVDGRLLRLENFSIINGGQTTHNLYKTNFPDNQDFFIPCKVVKAAGNNREEKDKFILEIATATNSQKAIKDTDLKANAPEQIQFRNDIRNHGIYYKTKRGDEIPEDYSTEYLHADYPTTGKLYLAGIYQLPGKSRTKPSTMKENKYYNPVFTQRAPRNVCGIIKDLLYINYYFDDIYKKNYQRERPGSLELPFANNSRTMCVSFIGLVARLVQNNIVEREFQSLINHDVNYSYYEDNVYPVLKNFENIRYFINPTIYRENRQRVDEALDAMFSFIIREGYRTFNAAKRVDATLVESNYLKQDSSYYTILSDCWPILLSTIEPYKSVFM